MKWAEAMSTFDNTGKTVELFIFNHVIAHFGVPQAIVTDHGSYFRNFMMSELTEKLGLLHDNSMPYYPQANGQVEVINKVLITMLRRMIGIHNKLAHNVVFGIVGLPDIRQVRYWVYTFSVSLWCGSHSPN
jgi:transposase InsO family protein